MTGPFEDLAKAMAHIAKHQYLTDADAQVAYVRDLLRRLEYAEELNQEAGRLLKHGPKGYGGPEKWMAARDAWLQRSGYGVK